MQWTREEFVSFDPPLIFNESVLDDPDFADAAVRAGMAYRGFDVGPVGGNDTEDMDLDEQDGGEKEAE